MLRTATAILLATTAPALALTPDEIRSASYDGGALSEEQTGLAFTVQVLLDRAGVSPGVIDGWGGGMTVSAIEAFERREGLEPDGQLDPEVWEALGGPSAGAVLQDYTITEEDASGLVDAIPEDYAEKAKMESQGYVRVSEKLAERFHMDEDTLVALNEGTDFAPGETILVAAPGDDLAAEGEVARIEVRKDVQRLAAFDADGNMIANYPVTVGSAQTPSPSGTVEVVAIAPDPNYTYDPDENFTQGDNDEVLIVPPGPNGPVGSMWIDLSKPTYGLHGTAEPASLFEAASHGCVRLTNWDAGELAQLVKVGTTVEFME
ncbi:L,D-transpeptidase [Jannaschia sp. W003]|uniref:L,D-transpeptidase family protein n=1 Tax=Jannaschia sp. W003 TaxID=2867012 RepID=UPI0021A6445F|nr:L,D-transpeptidase [Jannaschia sp. W003]UWQ20428.1 L,D-transpeptidase [Jannaschia sp. W003]